MSIAKVIEIVGSSPKSFDDAVKKALTEAQRTLRGVRGMDVRNFTVKVRDEHIVEYRVDCKIAFEVERERGGGGVGAAGRERVEQRTQPTAPRRR